ncbi:MAG: type VI secretion system baseplate subunit TssE [Phycisphaerales bacterium]|nr:type VI secretion system baseplate subunit TssE [Phycisphaerales bacterium]
MAREQALLDRLAAAQSSDRGDRYRGSTVGEDLEALMESIRRNLRRLLNARQGMCEAAPEYGLPTLSELIVGNQQYVLRVQDAIRTAIERYEPRLRRVRVTQQAVSESRHTLLFRVDAVMVGRAGEHRVWYETEFTPMGEFHVAG